MADKSLCTIPGCSKTREKRGWCATHYRRWHRHGDPLGGGTSPGSGLREIERALNEAVTGACWTWPYGKFRSGYAALKYNGKMMTAHRVMCIRAHGEPPNPKLQAAHSCGNGHLGCINPHHLDWKTAAQNAADRLSHGTHSRGQQGAAAKITDYVALKIKRRLKAGERPCDIAREFGVSQSLVNGISAGKSWAWLKE